MTSKHGSETAQAFEVEPHVGAGPIRLGQSREEVRRIMGAPFRTYSKVPGEPLTDTYFGPTYRSITTLATELSTSN